MDQTQLIKDRINIIDFISESIQLKKAGRSFKALCPFHSERTPSFIVSPERQIWRCFGCGKGGDVFTFLMELDRLEFPEALRILAERTGIKLEPIGEKSQNVKLREKLIEIHHLTAEYYHFLLTKHQVGKRGLQYLIDRGVTEAIINTFDLGFAPDAWDNLIKFLSKKGYSSQELELSGLSIPGRSSWYDRFRNRIMFPLKDYRGQTIAFAGRHLDKQVKEAKYINSPETVLYTKGETLYGLHLTKDAIRKAGSAVVVEGEFDAISSFQAGITNIVAIKGTALTEAQIRLIKRFTEKVVLALDQDVAGDQAARRGIELIDRAGMEIRVVGSFSGKDPDDVARDNPALWKKQVKEAAPFYDFIVESALNRFGTVEAYGKKRISDEVLPYFNKISNSIVQAHYVKKLAQLLDISEDKIYEEIKKIKVQPIDVPKNENPVSLQASSHEELAEEYLLALVLQSTDPVNTLDKLSEALDPSEFTTVTVRRIFMELIDACAGKTGFQITEFARKLPPELLTAFDRAYLTDLSRYSTAEYSVEVQKTIMAIKKAILRRKIKTITTSISIAEKGGDEAKLTELNETLNKLATSLKGLT